MMWAPSAGGKIRMVAKHFRDLAIDEDRLDICLRKAWGYLQKIDGATSEDFRILGSLCDCWGGGRGEKVHLASLNWLEDS